MGASSLNVVWTEGVWTEGVWTEMGASSLNVVWTEMGASGVACGVDFAVDFFRVGARFAFGSAGAFAPSFAEGSTLFFEDGLFVPDMARHSARRHTPRSSVDGPLPTGFYVSEVWLIGHNSKTRGNP
jgi:hypothetical protein